MTPTWPLPALVYSVAELTRLVKDNLADPRLGAYGYAVRSVRLDVIHRHVYFP